MRRLDTLRAIGALLHHAARAHGDIGILGRVQRRILGRAIVEEIEAPHLVGTEAGAGPRPDAPVIDHLIDAFGTVGSGMHRTPHLAGRLLAMHARHRLEEAARRLDVALVVARNPQPVHLAAGLDLLLADDGHVVFRGAGHHAGIAADAGIDIDHHAPGILRGRPRRVETRLFLRLRERRMRRAHLADEIKALHAMMQLRDRESLASVHFAQGSPRSPGVVGRHHLERVVAELVADPSGARAAIAERQSDRIFCLPRHHPHRPLNVPIADGDLDAIAIRQCQMPRKPGTDADDISPGQCRQRLWQFLQPADIGEAAVPNRGIGMKQKVDIVLSADTD